MIMFDIAEWIANLLILGMGLFFWVMAFGLMFYLVHDLIERFTHE